MNGDSSKKREWLLLAAIVAIAALLRFYRIGYQSYWIDEILSLRASAAPAGVSFWEKILHNVHGPLHAVIIHLLRNISLSEGLLRAPSAIAGTVSVVLFYKWLVMLGRRDIAPYGALFLAVSPFSLYYSQELRYYSLMAMFCIIALIAYERYLEDPSCRRGAVLGLAVTAAALSHFSALFLAAGLFVHLLVTGRMRRRHLTSGLLAALILLILISPWIYREMIFLRGIRVVQISELPTDARLRGELTLNIWSYPYALYAFSTGYSFGPSLRELHEVFSAIPLLGEYWREMFLVSLLFGGLAVAGLWKAGRNGRLSLFLSVMLVTVLLTTIIAAFNIKVFNIRYMMASFPVYLALITYGLPAARLPRLLVASTVCAVMLVSSWNYHADPAYARDDIRSAVSVIREAEREGDMLLSINSAGVVEHYYGGGNPVQELNPKWFGVEAMEERVERSLAENERIWYLRCRHWDTDPDDLLLALLESRASVTGRWSFPGVELYLFVTGTE
jgi:uncharacterized membrane protein